MDGVRLAWLIALVSAGWLLPVGAVRMLAYRSGDVDHTRGMRFVAIMALSGGAVAAVALVVLSIWLAAR